MEKIIGINDVRLKLTSLIDSLAGGAPPVIITVNSEPKGVMINYEEYCRLREAEKECKRLALKQAVEKIRLNTGKSGLTEEDVRLEVQAVRSLRRGKS
jgi:antitoxin YefM